MLFYVDRVLFHKDHSSTKGNGERGSSDYPSAVPGGLSPAGRVGLYPVLVRGISGPGLDPHGGGILLSLVSMVSICALALGPAWFEGRRDVGPRILPISVSSPCPDYRSKAMLGSPGGVGVDGTFLPLLPPSLSVGMRLRINPWLGSYCRGKTGS